jgi:hypothetical protein
MYRFMFSSFSIAILLVLLTLKASNVHAHGWLESVGGAKANYANWEGGSFEPPLDEILDHNCVVPTGSSSNFPNFKPGQNVTVQFYILDPDNGGVIAMSILSQDSSAVLLQGMPVPNVTATSISTVITLPNTVCQGCVFQWSWTLPTSGDPPLVYYGCVDMNISNNAVAHLPTWTLVILAAISVLLFTV